VDVVMESGAVGRWRAERMADWEGERRAESIWARRGVVVVGCGGKLGGVVLEVEARVSQADFSASSLGGLLAVGNWSRVEGMYLLTSSSKSCSVALFFSFCGFGFFALAGSAASSCSIVSLLRDPQICHSYPAEPV
jgi:hypothetical protein